MAGGTMSGGMSSGGSDPTGTSADASSAAGGCSYHPESRPLNLMALWGMVGLLGVLAHRRRRPCSGPG
jgi:hypothetical protein